MKRIKGSRADLGKGKATGARPILGYAWPEPTRTLGPA
jgi:hypothetical protein